MFQGSMVALVTPMRVDGTVDTQCLRDLIEWHIAEGTDAIVAVGSGSLSDARRGSLRRRLP